MGIAERYVTRGAILASSDEILAESIGSIGELQRNYPYPELGATVGYTLIPYSQAGLEASQDAYLRGIQDAPAFLLWYHHLVYGQTPPGMDIRTSLNLELQTTADQGLNEYTGAAVLINAQNGEILVMASHPTFDANQLTENSAGARNHTFLAPALWRQ